MKSLLTFIATYLFNTCLFGPILFGETPKAPVIFKEWITTERLIYKESSNWEIEKNALGDLIEPLEEEKQTIDEKLNSVEKENSAGVYGKNGGTGIGRVSIDKIVDEWNVSE